MFTGILPRQTPHVSQDFPSEILQWVPTLKPCLRFHPFDGRWLREFRIHKSRETLEASEEWKVSDKLLCYSIWTVEQSHISLTSLWKPQYYESSQLVIAIFCFDRSLQINNRHMSYSWRATINSQQTGRYRNLPGIVRMNMNIAATSPRCT